MVSGNYVGTVLKPAPVPHLRGYYRGVIYCVLNKITQSFLSNRDSRIFFYTDN